MRDLHHFLLVRVFLASNYFQQWLRPPQKWLVLGSQSCEFSCSGYADRTNSQCCKASEGQPQGPQQPEVRHSTYSLAVKYISDFLKSHTTENQKLTQMASEVYEIYWSHSVKSSIFLVKELAWMPTFDKMTPQCIGICAKLALIWNILFQVASYLPCDRALYFSSSDPNDRVFNILNSSTLTRSFPNTNGPRTSASSVKQIDIVHTLIISVAAGCQMQAVKEVIRVSANSNSSCRGLQGMLNQRRKLLQYLRRSDFDAYTVSLVRLGLRDNYAKQVILPSTFLLARTQS